MKRLLHISLFILFLFLGTAWARDPFWPIGYEGPEAAAKQPEVTQKQAQRPKAKRVLNDDELRELAAKESERIRQTLERKGTMIAGDRIFAYVQGKWVSVGDVIPVEVEGNRYRLEILTLTKDNIELEAHRAAGSLHTQPRQKP